MYVTKSISMLFIVVVDDVVVEEKGGNEDELGMGVKRRKRT